MNKVVYNNYWGGFILSDKEFKKYKKYGGVSDSQWVIERHEPALVKLVEEMIKNGTNGNYLIREIEGDRYYIEEYDGWEKVITPDDDIFTVIKK